MNPHLHVPLTVHHLTFHCRAQEPILWHPFKGSAVRGAFAGVLRRTFCPEGRDSSHSGNADQLHASVCPVCQLLSMPQEEDADGDLRRPYAVRPPLDNRTRYAAGEPFAFTVTLFGDHLGYLPYLALGAEGMGSGGIGRKDDRGGRGRFTIEAITSTNPLTKATAMLMKPGERMVHAVTAAVEHAHVTEAAAQLADRLEAARQPADYQLRHAHAADQTPRQNRHARTLPTHQERCSADTGPERAVRRGQTDRRPAMQRLSRTGIGTQTGSLPLRRRGRVG